MLKACRHNLPWTWWRTPMSWSSGSDSWKRSACHPYIPRKPKQTASNPVQERDKLNGRGELVNEPKLIVKRKKNVLYFKLLEATTTSVAQMLLFRFIIKYFETHTFFKYQNLYKIQNQVLQGFTHESCLLENQPTRWHFRCLPHEWY